MCRFCKRTRGTKARKAEKIVSLISNKPTGGLVLISLQKYNLYVTTLLHFCYKFVKFTSGYLFSNPLRIGSLRFCFQQSAHFLTKIHARGWIPFPHLVVKHRHHVVYLFLTRQIG